MTDVQREIADRQRAFPRQIGIVSIVHVAGDRFGSSDGPERSEHRSSADVAGLSRWRTA